MSEYYKGYRKRRTQKKPSPLPTIIALAVVFAAYGLIVQVW